MHEGLHIAEIVRKSLSMKVSTNRDCVCDEDGLLAELLDSIDSEAGTRIEKQEICRYNRLNVFFYYAIETAFKSIYVPLYVSIDWRA